MMTITTILIESCLSHCYDNRENEISGGMKMRIGTGNRCCYVGAKIVTEGYMNCYFLGYNAM
jgi:hypothetical protein